MTGGGGGDSGLRRNDMGWNDGGWGGGYGLAAAELAFQLGGA